LGESAGVDPTYENNFQEGYELYGSYRKAAIYAEAKGMGKEPAKNATLDKAVAGMEEIIFSTAFQSNSGVEEKIIAHTWLEYKILDELKEEGYDITFIPEAGVNSAIDGKQMVESTTGTLQEFKGTLSKMSEQSRQRDTQIARQINGLVNKAEEEEGETNIVALFGVNHHMLVNQLPETIKEVATIYTEPMQLRNPDSLVHRVMEILDEGGEVSEKMWRDAFNGKKKEGRIQKALQRGLSKLQKPKKENRQNNQELDE
jgi:hypothetical protein